MTCFYPREALLPHKMLNARMPEKRERTRYKLCNGSCVPNRRTSPSIRKCFCLAFFCLVFSLPALAFFLKENFRRIGKGPGRGRSELLPRPGRASCGLRRTLSGRHACVPRFPPVGFHRAVRQLPALKILPEGDGQLAGDGDDRHLPHPPGGHAVLRPFAEPQRQRAARLVPEPQPGELHERRPEAVVRPPAYPRAPVGRAA